MTRKWRSHIVFLNRQLGPFCLLARLEKKGSHFLRGKAIGLIIVRMISFCSNFKYPMLTFYAHPWCGHQFDKQIAYSLYLCFTFGKKIDGQTPEQMREQYIRIYMHIHIFDCTMKRENKISIHIILFISQSNFH